MDDFILSVRNISISFPGVKALDDVSLDIVKGEVHALIGENGAGKSTLMKILSGVYKEDEGEITLKSERVTINSVKDSMEKGISIVHQELNVVPCLSVMENIFLGRIPVGKMFIKKSEMEKRSREALDMIGSKVVPQTLMEELTIAESQMVEIARAVLFSSDVLILDEPTSSLSSHEIKTLFGIMRRLKSMGITIIYISHKLDEIFEICERATILRDGKVIGTVSLSDITKDKIIEMMVGRSVENEFPPRAFKQTEEIVLSVKNLLINRAAAPVSFDLRKGEVLGFAGLVGAGRTEVVKALFGVNKKFKGEIVVNGKDVRINSPSEAIKNGMAMLTESRVEGVVYRAPVTWNTTFANIGGICKLGVIDFPYENKVTRQYVEVLKTKTPSIRQRLLYLSGGNQQKVILSKWLFAESDILILDEATRGIDVGAKYEIYQLVNELTNEGKSIIFISSELPEVMAMSDRIVVMAFGRVSAIIERPEFTPENIMHYAVMEGEKIER